MSRPGATQQEFWPEWHCIEEDNQRSRSSLTKSWWRSCNTEQQRADFEQLVSRQTLPFRTAQDFRICRRPLVLSSRLTQSCWERLDRSPSDLYQARTNSQEEDFWRQWEAVAFAALSRFESSVFRRWISRSHFDMSSMQRKERSFQLTAFNQRKSHPRWSRTCRCRPRTFLATRRPVQQQTTLYRNCRRFRRRLLLRLSREAYFSRFFCIRRNCEQAQIRQCRFILSRRQWAFRSKQALCLSLYWLPWGISLSTPTCEWGVLPRTQRLAQRSPTHKVWRLSTCYSSWVSNSLQAHPRLQWRATPSNRQRWEHHQINTWRRWIASFELRLESFARRRQETQAVSQLFQAEIFISLWLQRRRAAWEIQRHHRRGWAWRFSSSHWPLSPDQSDQVWSPQEILDWGLWRCEGFCLRVVEVV